MDRNHPEFSRRSFLQLSSAAALAAGVGCSSQPASESSQSQMSSSAGAPTATPPAASVPGPVAGTRLTPGYVQQVGRTAYFWAWRW